MRLLQVLRAASSCGFYIAPRFRLVLLLLLILARQRPIEYTQTDARIRLLVCACERRRFHLQRLPEHPQVQGTEATCTVRRYQPIRPPPHGPYQASALRHGTRPPRTCVCSSPPPKRRSPKSRVACTFSPRHECRASEFQGTAALVTSDPCPWGAETERRERVTSCTTTSTSTTALVCWRARSVEPSSAPSQLTSDPAGADAIGPHAKRDVVADVGGVELAFRGA